MSEQIRSKPCPIGVLPPRPEVAERVTVCSWLESIGWDPGSIAGVTVWTPHDIDLSIYLTDENGSAYQSGHDLDEPAKSMIQLHMDKPIPENVLGLARAVLDGMKAAAR